eukprot:Transcript_5774.p1 GENE.Transcript_5774~~Transcript_5774.p1  ORF type:complete len:706 (-),score=450.95 Transcript_5774:211-2328(-)
MSEAVESVSSPAMPVNAKRKLDASKPDAAATGDGSKNKTKSALGGLQTKQVSKMEKLLAAEKKKAEVDAKKQKKEADAAEKPKPTQKPLSKLDRIVQRENAQKEAKKKQEEREKKKEEKAAKAALPKKPRSAYILYSSSERPGVTEQNKEASASDMLKILAEMWKELSDEEKQKWQAEAAADKERYITECKEAGIEPEVKEEKEDKEKKPQKPKSAFALYCVKERASVKEANADAETKEVTKLLTAQWKGLSEEEKQPFEAEADADKQRYIDECEAAGFEPELNEKKEKGEKKAKKKKRDEEGEGADEAAKDDEAEEEAAPAPKKKKAEAQPKASKQKKGKEAKEAEAMDVEEDEAAGGGAKESAGKKIKKPQTAYFLFQAAERPRVKEEHAGTAPKEVTKLLGEAWKALGAEDKKKWEAEALKDKQRYADECAAAGIELEAPGADKGKEEELKQELTAAQEQQKALEAAATAIKQPRAHKDAVACYKKAKRIEVATANPDMDVAQVVELMEDTFDKLSKADKAPYEAEAEADLRRYQQQCDEHKAKKDESNKAIGAAKKNVERLQKALKDEKSRVAQVKKAAAAANKAAKEEKAKAKEEVKAAKKEKKAEKAAAKKGAKAAKGGKKGEGEEEAAEKSAEAETVEAEDAPRGDARRRRRRREATTKAAITRPRRARTTSERAQGPSALPMFRFRGEGHVEAMRPA